MDIGIQLFGFTALFREDPKAFLSAVADGLFVTHILDQDKSDGSMMDDAKDATVLLHQLLD